MAGRQIQTPSPENTMKSVIMRTSMSERMMVGLVATLAVVVALLKNWDFLEGYTLHR